MELVKRWVCALTAALGCSSLATAQDQGFDFYVGAWGSDEIAWYECTVETPFASITRARDAVREYRSDMGWENMPIRVFIAGGEYPVTEPIVFTPMDSGLPSNPIRYIAWDPDGPASGEYDGDPLISGGIEIQGWTLQTTPTGVLAWAANVPAGITDIRDVWVNNQRLVRARFPNVPTCTTPYADPPTPPCPNEGYLVVTRVEAVTVNGQRRQRVFVRSTGAAIPLPADWPDGAHVEASATRYWVNPHQRVGFGYPVQGQPDSVFLEFPITPIGTGNTAQDLGALGCFYYDNWNPADFRPTNQCVRGYLQMVGEQDVTNPTFGLPERDTPAQLFLSNDIAFLDADKEWHFDAASNKLWLKVCGNRTRAASWCRSPRSCWNCT